MAHGLSINPAYSCLLIPDSRFIMFTPAQRKQLLTLARQSIQYGLQNGHPFPPHKKDFDPQLQQTAASFVTLNKNNQLRGCIGTLEARQPLVNDIAKNAFSAAFRDPRFSPLTRDEFDLLDIHISVLSRPQPMDVHSEADLLARITPGKDGLIFESGNHRGTFLPSVWTQLPTAVDFVKHLKIKAGLPAEGWPQNMQVSRYHTEEFGFENIK